MESLSEKSLAYGTLKNVLLEENIVFKTEIKRMVIFIGKGKNVVFFLFGWSFF